MPLAAALLPEFDMEVAATRRLLERLPDDRADWAPHPKAYSLGDLAAHLVNMLTWVPITFAADELDFAPAGGSPPPASPTYRGREALLATLDANAAAARRVLEGASDEVMRATWTAKRAGATLFAMPRTSVMRTFVLNHHVHHRGQLTVYLRMLDVPLPPIYGPTADESPF